MGQIVKELITKWTYKVDADQLTKVAREMSRLKKELAATKKFSINFANTEEKRLNRISNAWAKLRGQVNKTGVSYRRVNSGQGGGGLGGGGFKTFAALRGLGVAAGPSAALAAGPMAGLITGISGSLFAAGRREQAETGFAGFVGDKNAKTLTENLTEFAKNTPLTISGIRDMATEILAMGGSMESVLPTLKKIGDATGGNMDRMSRALFNYMEVVNKEAADKVDLKQFVRAGIPIYQQLAKQLKVSREELGKMVSDGKITGKIISEAFTKMTGTGGMFENRMFKMSKTFLGRLSNFQDAAISFAENFGNIFLPMATTGLRHLSAFTEGLGNLVSKIGDLKQLGPTIKLIAGVMFAAFNPLVTLFAAIFLVIDDLVAYSQKRKSVTGYLMNELNLLQKAEDLRKRTVESLQESTAGNWYLSLLQKIREGFAMPEALVGPNFMQKGVEGSPSSVSGGTTNMTINSNTQIGLKEGVSAEEASRMQNKVNDDQARLIQQKVRKTRSN